MGPWRFGGHDADPICAGPPPRDPMGEDPMGEDPMGEDPMGEDIMARKRLVRVTRRGESPA